MPRTLSFYKEKILQSTAKGSRGGTVVRALASQLCAPGSIPGPGVISGLSLLLVLVLAPRVFLRVLQFSCALLNNQWRSGIRGPWVCQSSTVDLCIYLHIFIYFARFIEKERLPSPPQAHPSSPAPNL